VALGIWALIQINALRFRKAIDQALAAPTRGVVQMSRCLWKRADLKAFAVAVTVTVGVAGSSGAMAGETEAKNLLKAMSDYLVAQKAISLTYDNSFEVVSKDQQKLQVTASGKLDMSRPDKLRVTRTGGFANIEMVFDGKTFTIIGRDANIYAQVEAPGTIDQMVDEIRDKYHKSIPGADLLLTNVYDELMQDVVDVKDLGSGVIGGRECDHLAFRAKNLDWQIWIAQGDRPYPCRFVITTTEVEMAPQYTLDIREWKAGEEVVAGDFSFKAPDGAKKLDPGELKSRKDLSDMPDNFSVGE
jgi:hypothetical protein